jgi:hypothetical protein
MTKVECVKCGEFHQVDSIEGQVGDKHAKVKYTCPENEVLYGAQRLVKNMKHVTQQNEELVA